MVNMSLMSVKKRQGISFSLSKSYQFEEKERKKSQAKAQRVILKWIKFGEKVARIFNASLTLKHSQMIKGIEQIWGLVR